MNNGLTIFYLISSICQVSPVIAQNAYQPTQVKTSTSAYTVNDSGTATIWRNQLNTLYKNKLNYNIDELPLSGLDLKDMVTKIQDRLKTVLSPRQKELFKSSGNLLATICILKDGQITETHFIVTKYSQLTIFEIELLEQVLKQVCVTMKAPQRYMDVNFIPINVVIRPKEFL